MGAIALLAFLGFSLNATVPLEQARIKELLIPKKQDFRRLPNPTTQKVGRYTNVRISGDGHPIIAFNDENQRGICVVHLWDTAHKQVTSDILDARPGMGDNGRFIRMEINPKNKLPYFTYISSSNRSTMMAFCKDSACTNFTIKEITRTPSSHPSISFRYDGSPIVAYRTKRGLRIAFCENMSCSTLKIKNITNNNDERENGDYIHVEVGTDNVPVFSWLDSNTHVLKYAKCIDENCTAFNIVVVDATSNVGKYNFMRLDPQGNAIIMYTDITNGTLKTAYCPDSHCSSPTISIIDKNIGAEHLIYGVFPEIGINPKTQLPVLSYVAQPNADDGSPQGILKIAQCKKSDCSDFLVQEVARGGLGYGRDSSMAFKDDIIYLTFLDYNNKIKRAYLAILKQQPLNTKN